MSEPLVVHCTFRIEAGEEERFKALLVELGVEACVENEPGCTLLWVHQDPEDPGRFMLYEQWRDRASFEASFESPWRAIYSSATEHLWAEPRVTTVWELVGQAGAPVPSPARPEARPIERERQ
jgi:quinol monooxygenase YgiN